MNRRLIIIGAFVVTIVTAVISLVLFRPAKPIVDIRGERLITIKDFGNEAIDVVITNTLLTAWVVMAILIVFWFLATRKKDMVPTGLQNLGEAIVEVIYGFVTSIAGEKNGRRFFPLIATFFIYIAFANWLSLTPIFNSIGMFEPLGAEDREFHEEAIVFKDGAVSLIMPNAKNVEVQVDESACASLIGEEKTHCTEQAREHAIEAAKEEKVHEDEKVGILAPYLRGINTDLMTPASFALVSLFFIEYWGISSLGFFRYMSRFISFRSPITFFVGILESVAEMARLISFSFRLFGNLLAGEILILVMTFLLPLVSAVMVIFYGLELFVGAIQAFVFGALTLVFATQAVSHHGGEEHAGEHETEREHS